MGGALGRTAATSAKAAFPAPPRVPPKPAAPSAFAQGEVAHGRAVANLFRDADITSSPSSSVGQVASAVDFDETPWLKSDDLMHALLLHAQNPVRHTTASLAAQFGVVAKDVATLEAALEHCVPYRVVELGGDKLVGEPVPVDTSPAQTNPDVGEARGSLSGDEGGAK